MTIGIAIPTYINHISYLRRLLDSIAKSTVLPQEVAVSLSEAYWENTVKYPFDLKISQTVDKRNVAQNTNTALSLLTTDILSVIGGDDVIHPQRNEFLLRAFNNEQIDIVVHNFLQSDKIDDIFLANKYDIMELYVDYIDTIFPNQLYPSNSKKHLDFANGFIAMRRNIFDKFKYNEDGDAEYVEDSLYNRKLIESGYKISYIKQQLVLYLKNPHRKP